MPDTIATQKLLYQLGLLDSSNWPIFLLILAVIMSMPILILFINAKRQRQDFMKKMSKSPLAAAIGQKSYQYFYGAGVMFLAAGSSLIFVRDYLFNVLVAGAVGIYCVYKGVTSYKKHRRSAEDDQQR